MGHDLVNIRARDGISIPCGVWNAEGDLIIYLHGVESHMGWFKSMAEKLQESGLSVYAFDRRGSGLSKEERGHIENYRVWIDDISDVINYVKKERPGKKLYLMGICGGGRFAADFAGFLPSSIDGLILISPAIKMKVTLPLISKLDVLLNSFLNPKKKIQTPLRNEMFTEDGGFLAFIKNDPLSLHELTARFYREMILMDIAMGKKIFNVDIPILTTLSGHDPIIDNKRMIKWYEKLSSNDKTLRIFSECCHFLPFEKNIGEISGFVAGWIKKRAGA